ncbi:hypothetical protein [Nocardia cyriacigeorgica]|uniref:hypothetical protein n=1 Tax=Nocardia cyriacigeorgica TaxID=135487 RepID=UPI002453B468|nr:hypothetical protein [Nocardia cyriacigeorgica]
MAETEPDTDAAAPETEPDTDDEPLREPGRRALRYERDRRRIAEAEARLLRRQLAVIRRNVDSLTEELLR